MSKARSLDLLTCPKRNVPPLWAAQTRILLQRDQLSTRSQALMPQCQTADNKQRPTRFRTRRTNFRTVWQSRHAHVANDNVGDAPQGKHVDDGRRAAGRCGRSRARVLRLTLAAL